MAKSKYSRREVLKWSGKAVLAVGAGTITAKLLGCDEDDDNLGDIGVADTGVADTGVADTGAADGGLTDADADGYNYTSAPLRSSLMYAFAE